MVSGEQRGISRRIQSIKGKGGLWEIDYQWVGGKYLNTTEP